MAIRLPDEVKELLRGVQTGLDRGIKGVGWVAPASIHLTLKFLGEIDDARVQAASATLEKAAEAVAPFDLVVSGVGAFPNTRAPRVVWAGIKESAGLSRLWQAVERGLGAIGFEAEERQFSPHLTLCRIKSPEAARAMGRLLEETRPQAQASFTVTSFAFMKSVLKPTGAVHTPIQELALKGQQN